MYTLLFKVVLKTITVLVTCALFKLKHAHTRTGLVSQVLDRFSVSSYRDRVLPGEHGGRAHQRFNKTARLTYTTWGSGNIESSIVAASSVTAV